MGNIDLDYYLERALKLQETAWFEDDTAIGAACLVIPSTGEAIFDVCTDVGHNCFSHAEQ